MTLHYDETHAKVDLEQLAALLRAVGFEHRLRDPEQLAEAVRGSRWVVTAWDGPRLVGFARAFTDGAFLAYVNDVAVHPDYQRHGVGTELVKRLLAGKKTAFILHADPPLHAFYRRLGFEPRADMLRRPVEESRLTCFPG